jgi:hypothetical protein
VLTSHLHRIVTEQVNPRPVAVARITFGVFALIKTADIESRMHRYAGWTGPRPRYIDSLPELLTPASVTVVLVLWVLAGLALVAGFKARRAAALMACLIVYILLCDRRLHNQHFYLMGLLSSLFAIGQSGAALAWDARGKPAREAIPGWPMFLMKVQLSVVYTYAALTKLNVDFLSGVVIYESAFSRAFARAWLPASIRESFLLNAGFAYFAVGTELLLSFGLWLRRLRHPLFTLGFVFHAGMWLLMPSSFTSFVRMFVFGALLLLLYPLFIRAPLRGRVLRWNPADSSADAWAARLRLLDWTHALRFEPAPDAPQADSLVLVDIDGGRYAGGNAVRRALSVFPLTCYAGAFLVLPSAPRAAPLREEPNPALPNTSS